MQARACCILSAVYTSERARLFPAVSTAAAIVQAVRPFDLLRLISRSGGARPSQGGFVSASLCLRLSVPSLRLFKSCQPESRKVESRKVESRQRVVSQSRQSREVKSRKSRKGRDIRVPTCAKVVKS